MTRLFPGIDPFIEGQNLWPDLHLVFTGVLRELLNRNLPSNYFACIDLNIYKNPNSEPIHEAYIEVRKSEEGELVSVIELLSPTNKSGQGRGEYLAKRMSLLHQPVHLIELDLLFKGSRLPTAKPLPAGHHYAMVSRAERRPDCEVYAWTVSEKLPIIPIPLKSPDADALVDLQHTFELTFERGSYERLVRYDKPIGLELADSLRQWVDARIKSPA